ncbi:MAG: carboxypeptidase regulatory-like domain-containing protein [Acidobacteriota bacterium]|nr:MAG: carboxypeptidase regulatory-like domain-containing protein [Acidobacteriota bacterium]
MQQRTSILGACLCAVLLAFTPAVVAQSVNASLNGVVSDATGGVIPGVEVTVTNTGTGATLTYISDDQGRYAFQSLAPGQYELRAVMTGFKESVQSGIQLGINMKGRVDVILQVGEVSETIEVVGAPSQLNFENATREEGINPDTLQRLPLVLNGTVRSSAGIAVLMPGVTTGGSNNAFDARINGGVQSGDEAIVDGVSMQQGTMSQSGMISIFQDFPYSPDMVSEMKIVTSNYEPQYGGTAGAVIIAETKSGGSDFHGSAFWFHRNSAFNARQFGAAERPFNLQHNYGANIGGPVKLPVLWSDKVKTYFYFNYEKFHVNGGATAPILTIPTTKNRIGDFSDWVDGDGNLIPVYDPNTLRANPNFDPGQPTGSGNLPFLRDQFMGCDGNSPNVICPDRIQNSWALAWMRHLPQTTWDRPLNNFQAPPVPDTILADTAYYFWRIDTNIGDRDHFYFSSWMQYAPAKYFSTLPLPIANESLSDPQNSKINRLNWTHTFSPTLVNHFAIGYLNRNEGYGSVNQDYVDDFPKIPGVAGEIFGYTSPPAMSFGDGFATYGNSTGFNLTNITTRPTIVGNDLANWIVGDHTIKFGAEYRDLGQNFHDTGNYAGSFWFGRGPTSLRGINSGHPIASFLLEQVSSGDSTFRTVDAYYARQKALAFYGGDTWKITPQLTLNYGIRWDFFTPATELNNRLSFFDPYLPNPAAGGRLGALAFADDFEARYGRNHPEENWKNGWAPRVGIAYSWDDKTVIRTGYGVFFHQAYCPGWGGCMNLDGYNTTPSFSGTEGGLVAAFNLKDGLPQDFARPPFLDPGFRNGQGTLYRGFEMNRRANSQQWNLTVERQVGSDLMASVAYVGNKGSRLPSNMAALNVLDPSLLSMGETLYQEFTSDDQVIAGVHAAYPGWVDQMTGCSPSVAQAMLPYPQFCSRFVGVNENAGYSSYHSLQAKVDKRFSEGMFLLVSYTWSKLMTTTGQTNEAVGTGTWNGFGGVISPFQRERIYSLANDDVPQVLSVSLIYDLPWTNMEGPKDWFLGGWSLTTIFRYSSGIPIYFRSGDCNIPGQFRMGCLPNYSGDPWAQDKGSFDPGKGPLFKASAFEGPTFNFTPGTGTVATNERGFGFMNHDVSFVKDTSFGENVSFQFRAEFFNIWNWHRFTSSGTWGSQAFTSDVSSPDFGYWNGSVSEPRTIQFGARLSF